MQDGLITFVTPHMLKRHSCAKYVPVGYILARCELGCPPHTRGAPSQIRNNIVASLQLWVTFAFRSARWSSVPRTRITRLHVRRGPSAAPTRMSRRN